MVSADRAIMPDYRWVFNFHALYMQNNFGKINSPEAFEKAIEKAKQYNDKHGDTLCTVTQVDGKTIVAVCDMLSRRVHKVLPQSGDIVYVDATSNLDRQDSKLTKFMTCSPAGGLPLGFVVTSSESENVLTAAFKALKHLLPSDAFYNRKRAGPVLFMTDDAPAEVNARRHVWPKATFLLCVWHVLTAVWRWLWNAKHQIRKDDRASLFKMFRAVLYAQTEDDYENKKELLLNDDLCVSYPSYIRHLQIAYFNRKETWTISVRNDRKLPTHSTNTSNYIEASFRLTKDGQFNRTKAYNLPDLLDILLDDSVYYEKRLLDIGNGRLEAFKNKSKYLVKNATKIREDQIIDIGDLKYIVESETKEDTFYRVDMRSGFCECKAGNNCGPCKHKAAISQICNVSEFCVLPEFDQNIRGLHHYIADGVVCANSWYRDLDKPEHETDVHSFVETRSKKIDDRDTNTEVTNTIENTISDIQVEEGHDNNHEISSDEDGNNDILNNFEKAMDLFKQKVVTSYSKTLGKGVNYFTKKLLKFSKQTGSTFEKSLFSIGKEISKPKTGGKRKKNGKLIPVQVTAKSRRQYKHRGRVVGNFGRRPKDQEKRTQLVISEDNENVYHTLPKQKKTKNQQIHSLKNAVESNRPGAKKH